MTKPELPPDRQTAPDALSDLALRLPNQVAQLIELSAGSSAADKGKRPAAAAVFRGVLRQVYESIFGEVARQHRIRLTIGLFNGRGAASAGSLGAENSAASDLLALVAAETAAAVRHSDGEWGATLQQMFEPVIALQPRWSGGSIKLGERSRSSRRNAGVYYTPDWIVQLVLDWTLDNQLKLARSKGLAPPAVYDPACGSGRFLVAALDRLQDLEILASRGTDGGADGAGNPGTAFSLALGRDIDPLAADLCSAALALQHTGRKSPLIRRPRIATGDSLLAARLPSGGARNGVRAPLVVVGNPPFVNAIGRRAPAALLSRYRRQYSDVRGAADTAAYFLSHAARQAGPGGTVGLVLPRAILNSQSAEILRGNLPHGLRPELIWAPDAPFAFAGAAVYFCVVVLGAARRCLFSTDPTAARASFATGSIESANWWSELCRTRYNYSDGSAGPATRLGDVFEVRAGLTAGEAYELKEHVVDSRDGAGIRLLTTGLIDPGVALWGSRKCRFLKVDYLHPRIADSAHDNPRLARRLSRSSCPKIIVAGLARRLECYLDLDGEFLASVSTLVITHPRDDAAMLQSLLEELNAPRSAELVYRELGAHALGGGNITIRKSFLLDYPLRNSSADWK